MAVADAEAPFLTASFPDERSLWCAVAALQERKIGPDLIGVLIGEAGDASRGDSRVHLASTLVPRRLHEEVRSAFLSCGATFVGNVRELAQRYGRVPHPGVVEDHDLKLPMGLEYPDTRRGRAKGG